MQLNVIRQGIGRNVRSKTSVHLKRQRERERSNFHVLEAGKNILNAGEWKASNTYRADTEHGNISVFHHLIPLTPV